MLLSMPLTDYSSVLVHPGFLGGAVEIAFLSVLHDIDVVVIDARTVLTMHIEFTVDSDRCIFLAWDGRDYTLVWNEDNDSAYFEPNDTFALGAAMKACAIWVRKS